MFISLIPPPPSPYVQLLFSCFFSFSKQATLASPHVCWALGAQQAFDLIDASDLFSVSLVEEDYHQSWWQVATSTRGAGQSVTLVRLCACSFLSETV